MKKILFSTLALVLLLMVSCKPDPVIDEDKTARVELNFVTEYQNSPLVLFNEDYSYPEFGNTFNVKTFHFLMTDLVLLKDGTGDATELSEVEFIDFQDKMTLDLATKGTARSYESIPTGEYSGIRFGLGVNNELNKSETVGENNSADPLGSNNFWSGWNSYVFSRMEGNFDMTGDGLYDDIGSEPENDFAYALHTGANEAFRTVTINAPITVTAGEDNIVKVIIDFDKILMNEEGEVYDVIETPTSHTTANLDAINEIMDNFKNAFSIR